MADKVRKVDYFKIEIPDKTGEGAKVLDALKGSGINLLAFTGFPRGRKAQLDFFPEDGAAFKKAAKKAGLPVGEKKRAFLIQGDDRVGAIADILGKLAGAGVGVTALDGLAAGGGRYGAILWVKPADYAKAAKAIGAS